MATLTPTRTETAGWLFRDLPRREDPRFLRGEATYVDDRLLPGALWVTPLRSPLARGRIVRIDGERAGAIPGVVAVVSGADLLAAGDLAPLRNSLPEPFQGTAAFPLAVEEVRYQGEPVAVVVSADPYVGEDAVQALEVDYEPWPAVTDPFAALDPAADKVHRNLPSNCVWHHRFRYGDMATALAEADRVVRRRLHIHRFTSAPLETAQAAVALDPPDDAATGILTVWSNLQVPERYRSSIAQALGIAPRRLHFQCPDIGGGFGLKLHVHWVILLAWLARRLGRPMRWAEDRTGHLTARHHGHEVWYDAELAVKNDGTILGLKATAVFDAGAYLDREPKGAVNQLRHATSLYRFRHLDLDFRSVVTNKCPTGPNRSYGKVQQAFLVERLVDEAARELGLDPAEMRRRNLVPPEAMPYTTPTGAVHDGGDYPRALAMALERFGYSAFRQRQAAARAAGRWLGVGVAAGVEASPSNASVQRLVNPAFPGSGDSEAARVHLEEDGSFTVAIGTVPQGHGHETVAAQAVADLFGVSPDRVQVTAGYDSWRDPATPYSGTHASRFAVMGMGAVLGAGQRLRRHLLQLAAHALEVPAERLVLEGGAVHDPTAGRRLTLAELARRVRTDLAWIPSDLEPRLDADFVYHPPFGVPDEGDRGNFSLTYAYSVAVVGVEIDPETGRVELDRVVYVHDAGRRLNPLILEGQAHGALAHQLGAAFWEAIRYDSDGQCLTATFKDYLTPTAADLPRFELAHLETPSLYGPLGARGGGEGAGTPLVAAVNAVADALAPTGVHWVESYCPPDAVWEALHGTSEPVAADDLAGPPR